MLLCLRWLHSVFLLFIRKHNFVMFFQNNLLSSFFQLSEAPLNLFFGWKHIGTINTCSFEIFAKKCLISFVFILWRFIVLVENYSWSDVQGKPLGIKKLSLSFFYYLITISVGRMGIRHFSKLNFLVLWIWFGSVTQEFCKGGS